MRLVAFIAMIAVAVLVAAGFPDSSSARRPIGQGGPFVSRSFPAPGEQPTNEITVRFKPGVNFDAVARLTASARAGIVEQGTHSSVQRFQVTDVSAALEQFRASPLVAEAAPSRNAVLLDAPNDPNFSYQWHLRSTEGGMWADTAWGLATNRGDGVTVAVIDTGVAYENHAGSLDGNPQNFVVAPDLAGTTFVDPWDFVYDEPHANDDHGHGTHVTGTITEDTNNALKMAGVAYNSTIMPIKAIDYLGDGTESDIVDAIYYAVDNGADVISMSLGFPGTGNPNGSGQVCTEVVGLNASLDYAYANGVTVIAASGNDGTNTVLCPAAHPAVIAVGATRFDAQVTSYSNEGSALDITAPGGDMSVDQNGDGYGDGVLQESFCWDSFFMLFLDLYDSFCDVFNMGTSMATPHVAGVAALLLGEDPTLTPDEVRGYLEDTARDHGAPGRDDTYGHGILDAAGAVAALLGVPVPTPAPVVGLDPPSDLNATAVSGSQINLTWTDNASAETGFKVERSTDGVTFTQIATVGANVQAYSSTGLTGGTTYHYRMRATNGGDNSDYSNTASAMTFPPPNAPSNLVAQAVSSSRIDVSWTDNSNNEQGFRVERSTDGVNWLQAAVLLANQTTFFNTNLVASTTYHYRVRAFDGTNFSAYSDTASATTGPAPAAPSNLTATAISSSKIHLTWQDNADNEGQFRLERSVDGVNFAQVTTLIANATSYTNPNLAAGTTFHYRIRANEGPNFSAYSNVASATTQPAPAAPTNLAATAMSSSRIDLTWTDNATNEQGFRIERSVNGGAFSLLTITGANATAFSNLSLIAGTTYTYRVRAYEGPNNSAYTNNASATTPGAPAAPTNLTATPTTSSKITLQWTDNSANEAGFKIERSTNGVTFTQIGSASANATTFVNSSLLANTQYTYRVRAYEGANHSAYSNTATAATLPPPSAPTNLTATPQSTGRILLQWTDNANNEQGFRLERSTDGVTFRQVALLAANATLYSNGGLVSGTTYWYRIAAYEGPNNSAFSNVASATAP